MRTTLLLAALLAAFPARAATLAEALDAAWARTPQARSADARADQLDGRRSAAEALFPAAPAASIGYRDDRQNDNRGLREWEAEIELPLWLPGQSAARRQQASAERDAYAAATLATRLELAGELRELLWQARLAEAEREQAQTRLDAARALETDVERRLKAGDLARVDLILARNETLAARSALRGAETALAGVKRAWTRLTGGETVARATEENAAQPPARHPGLAAVEANAAAARAGAALARASRRDNPELSFGIQRERGDFADPYRNTLSVRLRLPFASDARNQAPLAAASAEQTEAEVAARQLAERLQLDAAQARLALDAAHDRRALAEESAALAAENLDLLKRAFDLGEIDLPTLLRTQTAAHAAALEFARAQADAGLARARLNQTLGILP